ncbi:unnamed protein product [Anisakis simplex]|uniref:O-acyltransferase n=1 Tax=Anisakis simplex TaxID=6269 RepID=A0A0M3K1V2_ANISI|nr:unnamed protein product [Anisakis simplex]
MCSANTIDEKSDKNEANGNKIMNDTSASHHAPNHRHHHKKVVFREKQFTVRASLLTVLMEKSDMRALRNFITSCFILMFIGTMLNDTLTHKNPLYHFWLVVWNFNQLPQTLVVWLLMALSTLLPYFVLRVWSDSPSKRLASKACNFSIANSGKRLLETTRIAMKVHSFVRENVPRVIRLKGAAKDKIIISIVKLPFQHESGEAFPTIQQLAYYFFCPAFIYRDHYPRSDTRSWNVVLKYFVEVLLTILCTNVIFTQMIYPRFNPIDYTTSGVTFWIESMFASVLPGLLCLMLLFYGLLHCWLNMFSEMLYFGDREFYLDWWNSRNMAEYYRRWNLVVHDWLYAYVYRDIALLIGGKRGLKISQTAVFFLSAAFHEYWFGVALQFFYPVMRGLKISQTAVFFLSAAFHEYWFGVALQFFYPVMFVLYFIFGGIFYWVSTFIKNASAWNIAMFTNLLIGTGMFISFYSQEWYARLRCSPISSNFFIDSVIPRHWFCTEYVDESVVI